jgi:general secretion pathway protein G
MRRFWNKRRAQIGNRQGFTLIELMIVVAIIGILASIGVTLYVNVEARARITKAQADLRALASAVYIYSTHMGSNPPALSDLNAVATNAAGLTAGPFMNGIPRPPQGWTPYAYTQNADGTFVVSSTGDGTTVTLP